MKTLDLIKLANWTEQNVDSFVKKDFREFEHLSIDYPIDFVIKAWLFIILNNIGLCLLYTRGRRPWN